MTVCVCVFDFLTKSHLIAKRAFAVEVEWLLLRQSVLGGSSQEWTVYGQRKIDICLYICMYMCMSVCVFNAQRLT